MNRKHLTRVIGLALIATSPLFAGKKGPSIQTEEKTIDLPKECRGQEPLVTQEGGKLVLKYPVIKKDKKTKSITASYTILTFNDKLEQQGQAVSSPMSAEEVGLWKTPQDAVLEGQHFFVRAGKWVGSSMTGIKEAVNAMNPNMYVYKYRTRKVGRGATQLWSDGKGDFVSFKIPDPVPVQGASIEGFAPILEFKNNSSGEIVVVGFKETGDKGDRQRKFEIIFIDTALTARSIPLALEGKYGIVYATYLRTSEDDADLSLDNADALIIAAPGEGASDLRAFKCIRFNGKGEIVSTFDLKAPNQALAVLGLHQTGNQIVLVAGSGEYDDDESFEENFNDGQYSTVTGSWGESDNITRAMAGYQNTITDLEYDSLYIIKIVDNKVSFVRSNPVKGVKKLAKLAPEYKGDNIIFSATTYNSSTGEVWACAQRREFKFLGGADYQYQNAYLMRFDSTGKLVATYGAEREFDGSASTYVFQADKVLSFPDAATPSIQDIASVGGNRYLWLIEEAKATTKETTSFFRALAGGYTVEFSCNRGPRVCMIDGTSGEASEVTTLGAGEYFRYRTVSAHRVNDKLLFIGGDEDGKKLWFGSVTLK